MTTIAPTGQIVDHLDSLFVGCVCVLVKISRSRERETEENRKKSSLFLFQRKKNPKKILTRNVLGHRSDIADGSLREDDHRRTFNNLVGDYYVAPNFMDAVALHVTKNALVESGGLDDKTVVPLILGIWGGKGQGKTFQVELTLKKLGAEVVTMSAGEVRGVLGGREKRKRGRKQKG